MVHAPTSDRHAQRRLDADGPQGTAPAVSTSVAAGVGATYVADDEPSVAFGAAEALGVAVGVVVVTGAAEALAIGEFQGLTWYVVRLLIVAPFLLAWQGIAGRGVRAAVGQ